MPYVAGSWQDNLIEAFGGTHDFIGGQVTGLYDVQGNTTRGRSTPVKMAHEIWSSAAIIPSSPFALSELLSQAEAKGVQAKGVSIAFFLEPKRFMGK